MGLDYSLRGLKFLNFSWGVMGGWIEPVIVQQTLVSDGSAVNTRKTRKSYYM